MNTTPIKINLVLEEIKNIAKDVCQFIFYKPEDFYFKPGQYMDVFLSINGIKDYRSFSISSSPTERKIILTVKKTESEFKEKFFNLKKNDKVNIYGPLGGFIFNENKKSIVLISGGLGITPFRSMLKFNYDENLNTDIILFAFFSKKENVVFYDELKKISGDSKNIKVIYSLTSESKIDWNGETGKISKGLLDKYLENIQGSNYMIAGPTEMVDSAQDFLKEFGVLDNQVRIEYYPGYSN